MSEGAKNYQHYCQMKVIMRQAKFRFITWAGACEGRGKMKEK